MKKNTQFSQLHKNVYTKVGVKTNFKNISITVLYVSILLALFSVSKLNAQAESIQSGVTFQWEDTQTLPIQSATIQSITIDGTVFDKFVVPSSYEMTQLGHFGHSDNGILNNGVLVSSSSALPNWNSQATAAFQSKNLNNYFTANKNGRNICKQYNKIATTDSQKQTIFYSPAIPSNEGGIFAVTERNANNCIHVALYGIPVGGGPESLLGQTFVQPYGPAQSGPVFAPPPPSGQVDYWKSGRVNQNNGTIGIALFYLDDIAPTGSKITKIIFTAATNDPADGKFFILQKYAIDNNETSCIDNTYNGKIDAANSSPIGSTYSLASGPSPAGQSFTLNSDGTYQYTPSNGYVGPVTFDYQVCLPAPNQEVCDSATVTLNVVDKPDSPSLTIECDANNNDKTITVTAPLGEEYQYSIDNINYQSSPDFTGLSAGTYTVYVYNLYTGCNTFPNGTTISLEDLTLNGSVTNANCPNDNTGAIDITVSGGQLPYNYTWSNGSTSEDLLSISQGTYTVTVTDSAGCEAELIFEVESIDTENPTISVPSELDLFGCGTNDINSASALFPFSTTLSGNVKSTFDSNPNYNISDDLGIQDVKYIDVVLSSTSCTIVVRRTFTVTDDCGNTATENQNITITDTSAPDLTIPADVTVECTESTEPANTGEATANDTCGNVTITYTDSSIANCGNTQTITRTWTATDDCGNTVSDTQTINVLDTTPPTITIPGDKTMECGADTDPQNTGTATASDTCGNVTIDYTDATVDNCGNTQTITRTWTATDECGNSVSGIQMVVIEDNEAPTLSVPADVTVECTESTEPANTGEATANDTCGNVTITYTDSSIANCGNTQTITRTWTATDDCGNTVSDTQTINVLDTTPPTITIPGDKTMECGADTDPQNTGTATASDTCGNVTIDYTDATVDNCGNTQTITRTWTATDECGNSVSGIQMVVIEDNEAPTLSVPADVTVECTESTEPANTGEATANDTCGNVTITYTDSSIANCGNTQTITRTWTATDDCGNTVSDTQTINVLDTTPPTITIPGDKTMECGADTDPQNTGTATASDTCGNVTIDYTDATVDNCGNTQTITRTWTATDECGNSVSGIQMVVIEDNEAPTLSVPADVTVECTESTEPANTGEATANDTCGNVTITYTDSSIANCGNTQTITRTWTATDDCGNTVSDTQTISTVDTIAPDVTNCSVENSTLECTENNNETLSEAWNAANIATLQACATDTCDSDLSVSSDYDYNNLNVVCGPCGTLNVTYTVTDDCGNASTVTATLTFDDGTIPDLSNCSVTDESIECSGDDNEQLANDWDAANILALENCADDFGVVVTSNYEYDNIMSTCGQGGTITVIYTITDNCGNATTLTATLTLEDTTPPNLDNCSVTDTSIECSGNDNEQLANDWNAANILALENCGTDSCDTDFTGQVTSTYAYSNLESTCGQGGTIEVVYTITDDCGNFERLTAILTLEDTTPPNLDNCSVTDQSIECSGDDNEQLANDWDAANIAALESCGTDTCDTDFNGQVTSDFDYSNLVTTCGQGGTIPVIYTITDDCGNATTLTATLTLEDTIAPDLSGCSVENTTLECDETENESLADAWNTANIAALESCAVDSCDTDFTGQVTSDYDFDNLNTTCGPCGTINVTYTILDDCGNTTTLTATLTFDDGTIPDVSNCSVTDDSIECSGNDNEQLANDWNAANISALENCADDLGITVTSNYDYTNLTPTCGLGGTITVVYTITDDCGNATTLTATLTLEDTTPPNLDNCSVTDTAIECSGDDNEQLANDWNAANIAALEDCGVDSCDTDFNGQVTSNFAYTNLVSTCGQGGTIEVIYTITDDCGNASTLNAVLTLEDTTPPNLDNCSVTDTAIECSGTDNQQLANDWNAANIAALENCGADSCDTDFNGQVTSDYAYTNLVSTCGQGGTIEVTYTITDDCGNASTLNAVLTIEDTTPPNLDNCSVTDESIECSGNDNEQLANDWNAANIAALENCGADSCDTDFNGQVTSDYAYTNLVSTCGLGGTIEVIYTINDDCGNTATLTATLTLEDTVAPDLTGCTVENTTLECDETENESLADAWNAANIAALEACALDACDADFNGQVTSDYNFENLNTTCGPCGTINVTYTITDDCGNATTLTATLTFDDGTIPDLSNCSVENDTIECSGTDNEQLANDWNAANISALENCADDLGITVTSNYDYTNLTSTCGLGGNIIVVYTITDDCGNATTLTATLTLEDTTPPNLDNCSVTDTAIECSGTDNQQLANDWNAANIAALEDCGTDSCDTDLNGQVTTDYAYSNLVTTCGQGGTIAVIYTITDDCGNTTTLTATLTLEDTTPPNLDNCSVTDESIECSGDDNEQLAIDWNTANISALENCISDSCDTDLSGQITSDFAYANLVSTCGQGGTISVVYTITDNCNNVTTLNATLTLEDTTPPNLDNCSVIDTSIECSGDNNEQLANDWNTANISALENCGADNCDIDFNNQVTSDFAYTNLVTTCGLGGTIEVTYTITDDCGNSSTVTATLTLEDTTAPDVTGCTVENTSLECDETENESLADAWNAANIAALEVCAVDSCDTDFTGQVTSDYDFNNLNTVCGPCGTITVNYTITDDCGNATVLTATLTFGDETIPDLSNCDVDDETIECVGDENATLASDWNDNNIVALQACADDISVTVTSDFDFNNYVVTCGQSGTLTVVYTITDECENSATLTATLTIEDTTAPTFTVPADITIECDQDPTDITLTGDITDETDLCSGELEASYLDTVADGDCANESVITRTWTLTDDCGNVTTQIQTITIQDTTAPTFTMPADVTLECDADLTDVSLTGDVTDEADNCSENLEATFVDAVAQGDCANESVITRTWTLTDDCGNVTTQIQTITIQDTTAPTFTVPADVTLECDADLTDVSLTGDVTNEADNCSENLEATFVDAVAQGDCANESVITRTWTLTDDCGNVTNQIQTITIHDTTAPTFNVPADVTLECDADLTDASLTGNVTDEADNCSTDLEASYEDTITDGDCANESVITRNWTLTDDCDNTTTLVQTITIQDTTAPTFTVPADMTLECDADITDVSLTGDVIDEADNCSEEIEAIFTDEISEGNCANESVIIRTWTLTDECGNTTTAIQTITLEDTTAPTFTVPADIALECDADITDVSLTGDVTDEADNCSEELEATFVDTITDGSCVNEYVITRVWTVTDDCDNATALVQTITIQDTTAPTFTVPSDVTLECDEDLSDINLTGDVTDEDDNCSEELEATFTDEVTEGDCPNNLTITRTWTLTDDCENTTTATQIISVIDSTAPTLVGEFVETIDVVCSEIPEVPELVFEDACSTNITVEYNETSSSDGTATDYTIIRDWFVSDECGNESLFTQTVNVSVENTIETNEGELCIGDDFDFDLFSLLTGDYDPDGVWTVTSGGAIIDGSFFNPTSLLDSDGNYTDDQLTDYEFTYTYEGICPGEATVTITLNDDCVVLPCGEDDLVISKAVTANFDGVNEFFTITGTEDCGFVYELQIFNRWGAKIYENFNYQNDWNGTSSKASVGNSDFVPTGTYYYVLNIKNSGLRPITGPIYVSTK
ncbi:gliding motility-associated C-terminal domain-containing protein [Psychroserpens sp. Hel_I_66]|uniref:HYR-like domain-containing protein n=1 Tax=Psychroserpens sp. Hel_I_66 TaxID=1250004 RepID=UPI0006490467|nr:gliding motility-associated C-terminal domain-containing protein [Psychroserpens sp. Hel_I_66]